jgi:hypothetical protein
LASVNVDLPYFQQAHGAGRSVTMSRFRHYCDTVDGQSRHQCPSIRLGVLAFADSEAAANCRRRENGYHQG